MTMKKGSKKMNYKVCILAAGAGARLGSLAKYVHPCLLPVNFKPSISYIIEKFPKEKEIVIAVGHKKEHIIDYLHLAYPDRNFTFVEIENFVGPGSGPGHSLLKCKEHLQMPFVFFTADTIVLEEIPEPDKNWFGIAPVKEPENYCTVKIKNNLICQLDTKIQIDNKFAFIGLAGVKDYDIFFDALENNREPIKGEVQVISGFKKLIEKRLVPTGFTWFDTGSKENYIETNKSLLGGNKKFDFSKNEEFLYFVDGKVIKFFANKEHAKKRVERAGILKGLCPEIHGHKGNFYSYKKVDGHVLYDVLNPQVCYDFLNWSKRELWIKKILSEEESKHFKSKCKEFYYDKTIKRINDFHEKKEIIDGPNNINGVLVPSLNELLSKVDWEDIYNGVPVRFHGDFTVANILVTREIESQLNKFILLDWRHDFAGLIEYGDLYYDLAKLYKGIILSDVLIKEGMFSFDMGGTSVYYDYFLKQNQVEAKEEYEKFMKENEIDINKVKTITAIALLNMSPLHQDNFNYLVYYLGKSMLHRALTEKQNGKLKAGGLNDNL